LNRTGTVPADVPQQVETPVACCAELCLYPLAYGVIVRQQVIKKTFGRYARYWVMTKGE